MTENVVSLGERLRNRREELGLSQAQAARELDVARTAYRLWEMEASKPAPDRWRMIARWLGISVAAMLLADELIDAQEAVEVDQLASRFPAADGTERTEFFEEQRSMIGRGSAGGLLDEAHSVAMTEIFNRLQAASERGDTTRTWLPAEVHKQVFRANTAPSAARAALIVAAAGIPEEILRDAEVLVSEIVTTGVRDIGEATEWIAVHVTVDTARLRVEVTDPDGVTRPSRASEASVLLLSELATRWGTGREGRSTVTWFEMDLPRPGTAHN
jgi:transcriptional regulator with XRE-family HTH domain